MTSISTPELRAYERTVTHVRIDACLKILIPLLLAASIIWCTRKHGLSISTDSVYYITGADSLLMGSGLRIPMVPWDSLETSAPYYHHGPFLPICLAGISRCTGLAVVESARYLNAFCILVTSCLLLQPFYNASGFVKISGFILIMLLGPALYTPHICVWSEPLFLMILACTMWIVSHNSIGWRNAMALGMLAGSAILTRYAGLFAVPAIMGLLLLKNKFSKHGLASLFTFSATTALVVLPWGMHLANQRTPPRQMELHLTGLWASAHEFCQTTTEAFLPFWIPLTLNVLLMGFAAVFFAISCLSERSVRSKIEGVRWKVLVPTVFGAAYAVFVVMARIIADESISFDGRMLSPLILCLALISCELATLFPRLLADNSVALIVVGHLICQNATRTAANTYGVRTNGSGFGKSSWTNQSVIPWIRELPADVLIYSNSADGLAAVIQPGRTVHFLPLAEIDVATKQFSDYAARVTSQPAVFVEFDEVGRPVDMPIDRLFTLLPQSPDVRQFPGATVYSFNLSSK